MTTFLGGLAGLVSIIAAVVCGVAAIACWLALAVVFPPAGLVMLVLAAKAVANWKASRDRTAATNAQEAQRAQATMAAAYQAWREQPLSDGLPRNAPSALD